MAKSVTRVYLNKVKSLLNDTNTNIKALSNALVEKGILDSSFTNKACTAGDILAGLAEYESWHPVLMSEDEEGAAIAEFDDTNASGTAIKTKVISEMPIKGYGKDGLTYIDPTDISKVYNSINNTTVATDRVDGDKTIKRWTSRSIFKFFDYYYKYDRRKFEIPVKDIRNGLFLRKGNDLDGIVDKNGLSLYPYPEEIIMISEKKESNFIHFINAQYTDAHYGHFNGRNYNFMIVRDRERIGKLNSEGTGFETYLSVYANDVETELAYIDKKDDGEWYWNIPVPDKVYGEEMLDSMWDVRIVWRRDEPDRSFNVSYDLEVQEMSWLGEAVVYNSMPVNGTWGSICYGNGKFVALVTATKNSNFYAYSSDGITWTQGTLPISRYWKDICYGNGKFVAISYLTNLSSLCSSDGITWTQGTLPTTNSDDWEAICYGNGKFVIVSYDTAYCAYSSDGITWTKKSMPVSSGWNNVCYGKDKFIAISLGVSDNGSEQSSNVFAYSSDGITWTKGTLPETLYWETICYGNGKFVVLSTSRYSSSASSNVFAYSSDGITWTKGTLPISEAWRAIYYGENEKYIAVANSSDIFIYSSDGITWSQGTLPLSLGWIDVCYGNKNVVITSQDSRLINIPFIDISALDFDIVDDRVHLINESTENIATTRNQVSNYAEYSGDKNIIYEPFILNNAGNIVSGSDFSEENKLVDVKWTEDNTITNTSGGQPSAFNFTSIAYNNSDRAIAVSNTSSKIFAYGNGSTGWAALSTLPAARIWRTVCYGNGKFVVFGYNSAYAAYSTTGGTSWTQISLPASKYWYAACYGKDKFVVIAQSATSSGGAYSSDGITWTAVTLPKSTSWIAVCYGSDKFVALDSSGYIMYSDDGITWTLLSTRISGTYYHMCYGDNKFIAIGYNSSTVIYSSDGITWTKGTLPVSGTSSIYSAIAYGRDRFIALPKTSSASYLYSLDGITWTKGNLPAAYAYNIIMYNAEKFVFMSLAEKSTYFTKINNSKYISNMNQIPTQIFKLSPDSPVLPNCYIGFSYRTDLPNRGSRNGFNATDLQGTEQSIYAIVYDKNLQYQYSVLINPDDDIPGSIESINIIELVQNKFIYIESESRYVLLLNVYTDIQDKNGNGMCYYFKIPFVNNKLIAGGFIDMATYNKNIYQKMSLGWMDGMMDNTNYKFKTDYLVTILASSTDYSLVGYGTTYTTDFKLLEKYLPHKYMSCIRIGADINYTPILIGREKMISIYDSLSSANISTHDYKFYPQSIITDTYPTASTNLHVIAQKRNYAIIEDTSGSKSIVKLIEKYTFDKDLLANPTV